MMEEDEAAACSRDRKKWGGAGKMNYLEVEACGNLEESAQRIKTF